MSSCDESSINKNYIVQSPTDFDILSACTGFYTNNIYNCTGNTLTLHSTIVSANTINSAVYLSGGTNLLDIFGSMDTNTFVTGTTLNSNLATVTRNDNVDILLLSGGSNVTLTTPSVNQINIDVSIPPDTNTFVTASTLSGSTLILTRNDGVELTTDLSSLPITDLGKILFVSETGDDSTGTRGDINKPFRNLYGAKSAATSGDTVYVFPGTWTYDNRDSAGKPFNGNIETLVNLWKNGVDYYFSPNSKVIFLNQGGVSGSTSGDRMYLFRPPFTQYETCNVYGKLDFETSTFCCNNNGGYSLLFDCGNEGVIYNEGYSCNLEFNSAISNANQAIQIGVSTSATSISYLNIVADTISVDFVEGQSGSGGAIFVLGDGKFEGTLKINTLNSWFYGFYNRTVTSFSNPSDFKLRVDIDTTNTDSYAIRNINFIGDSFYNIGNSAMSGGFYQCQGATNGTTTLNANIFNVTNSTASAFDINSTLDNTTISNGNIFTNLTSGGGRRILLSRSTNNTTFFNSKITYDGVTSTTQKMFDVWGGVLNLETTVSGSFSNRIINNRNGKVLLSNCNFNPTVTGSTLLGNDVTTSTGTTSIRNSTIILDNSTTDLCDGQYLNTYILNSNIKNNGTSDIFTNSTNTGLLQINNSNLVTNGSNTINISGNSPLVAGNLISNTPVIATNISGIITELTELDIE
jgi:hypothetical protein